MQLQNYVRNEFNKCDTPANTLKRITRGLDIMGLNVGYSGVKASDMLYWGRVWIDSLQIVCEGKGLSMELARASAFAELAERLSAGLYYPAFDEQVRFHLPALYSEKTRSFLNYQWMKGYLNAHQEELDVPFLGVEELLSGQSHLTKTDIEEIKNSEMAGHWVDGYSLVKDAPVKVPIKFAAYIHGTNGLAAGNVLEEAIIQAVCEIFERHTQIRAVRQEKTVPSIDPDSIQDHSFSRMKDFYTGNNVEITFKDLSFNGLFPVIAVLYTNHNLPPDRMEYRTLIPGASLNMYEALSRCFTEGIQGRESLRSPRPQLDRPSVPRSRADSYYLLMRCGVSPVDLSFLDGGELRPCQPWQTKDLSEEVDAVRSICKKLETDCIILDHTHPVLEFPVVRVLIPGISDFLPFLPGDVLTSEKSKPSTAWKGQEYKRITESFFSGRD